MENAEQSTRADARIIRLRTAEISLSQGYQESLTPAILDLHTLEYIDQLLDAHFK